MNLDLGGKPEYGASAGDGKVYANLTDISEVVDIDSKNLKVTRRWSTAPCRQTVAMSIETAHHRLFSGCRSGVLVVSDYQSGKAITTLPIGMGVDPLVHRLFVASGEFGPRPQGRGRPPVLLGSFALLVIER